MWRIFSGKTRSADRNRPTFRPTLEVLEDRWVPSTLMVRNNLDSGAGSLRAEITAASKNDTIVFAPSLNGQSIALTSGEMLISKNLTIAGPGAGELTISGNHASRVFEVAKGKQVTLSGLTISNGRAAVAGGILNHGTLAVNGSTLSDNSAVGSIYVAGSGNGGAIENYGMLTISASTVAGNSATLGGGGICNLATGTLTVTNSTLSGNSAKNDGGGINNDGTVTLSGSILSSNSAYYGGGGIINGGTLTVSTSTLADNSATGPDGGGGGILNEGTMAVRASILSGNSAYRGGAIDTARPGTATVSNSFLSGNVAAFAGGGIYVTGGTLTLSGSTLSGNVAASMGGGIFNSPYGTVTVKNSSSITGNAAAVDFGADVYNRDVLYLDIGSTIGVLDGNAAAPI